MICLKKNYFLTGRPCQGLHIVYCIFMSNFHYCKSIFAYIVYKTDLVSLNRTSVFSIHTKKKCFLCTETATLILQYLLFRFAMFNAAIAIFCAAISTFGVAFANDWCCNPLLGIAMSLRLDNYLEVLGNEG